ncbi:MAG: ATP-dependent Clp protease adapter ClpS [Actinomycetia bacterium]|nr:ATP-dependent Clp protease adapter ClpS [Actinomycetes bacterium]
MDTGPGTGRPTESGTAVLERPAPVKHLAHPWQTVVWNDPVNLMTYVTYVFSTYFGYPRDEAERLMMLVHTEGRAIVSRGGREQMERDVNALHEYGLWATMEQVAP